MAVVLLLLSETMEMEKSPPEFHSAETHIISPQQLKAHASSTVVLALTITRTRPVLLIAAILEFDELVVDLARCDAAKGQVSRELCAELGPKQAVSGLFVLRHAS